MQTQNKGTVNMENKTELDCMIGQVLMNCLETTDISNILHISNGYENSEFVEDLHKTYLIGKNTDKKNTLRCETQLCVDDSETYILYGFIKDISEEMDFLEFSLNTNTLSDFTDHFKNELNTFIKRK